MLSLDTALLKAIARGLGIRPEGLARDEARRLVRKRMERRVPEIAAAMEREGWTVPLRGEGPVIRDALFRLWRQGVFQFKGGGRLTDLIRDAHDDKVLAALAEAVTEETPLEELVRRVMDETLEIAF